MTRSPAVVVTTINTPTTGSLRQLAEGCSKRDWMFIVAGDTKSPKDFELGGCEYLSIEAQVATGFELAEHLPTKHYARKNIAYLQAMKRSASCIIDTDDDNFPREEFWNAREIEVRGREIGNAGWVNVYSYFTQENIWPRGFPLEMVQTSSPAVGGQTRSLHCPVQQGLADENPDVDAVYRMLMKLPLTFNREEPIVLSKGSLCPTNSQNTTFFPEAFPLLYLPSYCSFRMTDIWRGFVAWRICKEYGWGTAFHNATVYQERNDHVLIRDFEDEIPGYLANQKIIKALEAANIQSGQAAIFDNLMQCYEVLVGGGWVDKKEIQLLRAWIDALGAMNYAA